jgi:hypothetical protein
VPISSFTQAQIGMSPSGNYWTITVNATSQPSANDTVLLSGTSAGVDRFIQEGFVQPGLGFALAGRPNAQVAVNDVGDLGFRSDTDAASNSDEMVLRYNRATSDISIIAREGSPIPGITPTESHSVFTNSVNILNDGRVSYRSSSTTGSLGSDFDAFIFLSAPTIGGVQTIIEQSGTFVPTNQIGGVDGTMINFNDEAYVSADATEAFIDGEIFGIGRAIIVNRRVVLQNGTPLPGLGGELATGSMVDEARMCSSGTWSAWGTSAAGTAFIIINEALYAKEGDPVPGGKPGETLSSFSYMHINSLGDIAYAARTSASREVIVVDRVNAPPFIAVSTIDPALGVTSATQVDIDGSGELDDAYVTFIFDDTIGLSDAGELYFVARTTSVFTTSLTGDALFVYSGLLACPSDFDGSGFVDGDDFDAFVVAFESGC